MPPKGKKNAPLELITDFTALKDLINHYHNSKKPSYLTREKIVKSIQSLSDAGEPFPPKVAVHQAPTLGGRMTLLDRAVGVIEAKLRSRQFGGESEKQVRAHLDAAQAEAREFSDKHFVMSLYYPRYEFELDPEIGDLEDSSDGEYYNDDDNGGGWGDGGGDGGGGGGGSSLEDMIEIMDLDVNNPNRINNGSNNGPAGGLEAKETGFMRKLMEKRDYAAKYVHTQWDFYPASAGNMKKAAAIVHQLHRDYLRFAYHYNKEPTPIPRKVIDSNSPPEFQQWAQQLGEMKEQKMAEDDGLIELGGDSVSRGRTRETLSRRLARMREKFTDWSHHNLSIHDQHENNATLYMFIDDGMPEPLHGGPVPDVKLTMSQAARLMRDLKDLRHAAPTVEVVPYLPGPVESDADVVAYRGHLLALRSGPGVYRLISMSEQILHTRESLHKEPNICDVSNPKNRVLHNIKAEDRNYKLAAIKRCLGIIGVAHRGYHTLNRESAKRNGVRIGDCLIEVAWKEGEPPSSAIYGHEGPLMTKSTSFNSWENRTSWRQFRGEMQGDLEIYKFAKMYDNGLIGPDGGLVQAKATRMKAIEARLDKLRRDRSALAKYKGRSNSEYSADSAGEDESDDEEGSDNDDNDGEGDE